MGNQVGRWQMVNTLKPTGPGTCARGENGKPLSALNDNLPGARTDG